MPSVTVIDRRLLDQVLERAERSPRRRMNHNLHATPEENPNRLVNAMLRGTYIVPHRHVTPPKTESFLVLRGSVVFFVFDDGGQIARRLVLEPGVTPGVDVPPGVWHTLSPLSEQAICYETKPGPYAVTDKDLAPWAPREDAPAAAAYLESLLQAPVMEG